MTPCMMYYVFFMQLDPKNSLSSSFEKFLGCHWVSSMLTLTMCHFIATWCLLTIDAEMDHPKCIYSLYQFTGSTRNRGFL